ncbi:MAG TPA: UDP-N-acetylmuramoyl-tripeptide--D-alanyl-D-alanine ligase [Bryobacteraceae bacterium]|nr:UDP-N-acetylmuramoyl-tripeptide--D-alanyl-D-alanine ligase [Bryobacteraceae bacterium]
MNFSLKEVARALGVETAFDAEVTGWSIDSRTIGPGELFFALRGPNHDGNVYIEDALRRGAVAAIAERPASGTVLVVSDALRALGDLASWARQHWGGDVVGVTGSAGKTTTKDAIAELLSVGMPVGRTVGNFNNNVGLPLSILRLPADARVAVLELGMNHAGEIAELAKIARPEVAVVTNVGYAHVENFESIEGVAAAKRELVEALPPGGTAVLNADDPRVARFGDGRDVRVITYGLSEGANVRADNVRHENGATRFRACGTDFETSLAGRHGVLTALAGIAVAQIYGLKTHTLVDAVRRLQPGKMRGQRSIHNGILIIDDCYNSNPEAARAMIDVLRAEPAQRHVAVLGEMRELGNWSERLHRQLGEYAANNGVDVLIGIHGDARAMVDEARRGGLAAAEFFDDPESAGERLRGIGRQGDAILFKGSRGTHVEKALERFRG